MFYGVYYYNVTFYGPAQVYLAGFYQNINDANDRLFTLIPEHKQDVNNCITNGKRIGWVNKYEFGNIMGNIKENYSEGYIASQPHSSINIY